MLLVRQTDALPGGDTAAPTVGRVQRASSAVNLARVGRDAELRRLQDDFRVLKEAAREQESQLEELRSTEAEARAAAVQCRSELEAQRQHVQRHLTQVQVSVCSFPWCMVVSRVGTQRDSALCASSAHKMQGGLWYRYIDCTCARREGLSFDPCDTHIADCSAAHGRAAVDAR